MYIIRKQDKKTGERVTVKAIYNKEDDAINAIKNVLTEYEYYKTLIMQHEGSLTSNMFYSKYYYYSIIHI